MSSDLIKSRLLDAALNDPGLVPKALFGFAQFVVQVRDALATPVLQVHPFQIVPDPLGWVQLWRIAGKLLQVNPAGCTLSQIFLHCLTTVDRSPIPDDQQLPRNMP